MMRNQGRIDGTGRARFLNLSWLSGAVSSWSAYLEKYYRGCTVSSSVCAAVVQFLETSATCPDRTFESSPRAGGGSTQNSLNDAKVRSGQAAKGFGLTWLPESILFLWVPWWPKD